ncbi:MAG: hypothetical protein H0T08_09565 [Acidobacteria bacterium]|jgi:hypothetical protein|nr:hypothetical protein [Acidobacteriota bacterium]
MEWLSQFWESLTWSRIILGTVLLILQVIVSYAAIIFVMVKLPADYFSSTYAKNHNNDSRFLIRWGGVILKNLIGFLLILVGIVMVVTPGPGGLTILLGLIMMDIPGKRPLEAKLIQKPAVLSAINKLRARYDKIPLIMD